MCQEDDIQFLYNENTAKQSDNIMDKWIQSFTQSLMIGCNTLFLHFGHKLDTHLNFHKII